MKAILVIEPKFDTGQVVLTQGVNALAEENEAFAKFIQDSFLRHIHQDWGDVDPDDKATNDAAIRDGERVLSAYNDDRFPKNGISTLWIVTEWDRSVTTVLFPDEY